MLNKSSLLVQVRINKASVTFNILGMVQKRELGMTEYTLCLRSTMYLPATNLNVRSSCTAEMFKYEFEAEKANGNH